MAGTRGNGATGNAGHGPYPPDTPPVDETYEPRPWQKPFRRNMTGTPGAYRPKGSVLAGGVRPRVTGDYKAWTPGE